MAATSSPLLPEDGAEHPLHHARKLPRPDQGKAADLSFSFPRDEGELLTRLDTRPFPHVLREDHLPPLIDGQHRLDPAAGTGGAGSATDFAGFLRTHNNRN